MKKYFLISVLFLSGCQSMGEHFTCLDEANRITRTEQRYVRTETKCVRSDQQSLGGGQGTIYNPGRGDVNCTSTPIYETVILNQSERDSVYQNCRNRIANQTQRTQQQTSSSGTSGYYGSGNPCGNLKLYKGSCVSESDYARLIRNETRNIQNKQPANSGFCRGLLVNNDRNSYIYQSQCE